MTLYSWQTVNTGNLAEQVCRPTDYFQFPCNVEVMPEADRDFSRGPVIFGASGLLYPEIAPILETAVANKQFPMIAWGIGNNTHYGDRVWFPDWLAKFDLCGLRDFGSQYEYVPCPSCMNPVFAEHRYDSPQNEVVIYDQADYPVAMRLESIPRMSNYQPKKNLDHIVAFLASGKVIITSSYHGAYWGYLLNRRVLIWEPWSTKFYTLQPRAFFVDENNWRVRATIPQDNADYLEYCQSYNKEFHKRVTELLCRYDDTLSMGAQ